jgi:hypothetical protein
MFTTQTWKFRCGHQFFHIKHQANEVVTPSGISSLNMPKALIESPDQCPECTANDRAAQEKKEKAREKCRKAVIAHEAHSKFLNTRSPVPRPTRARGGRQEAVTGFQETLGCKGAGVGCGIRRHGWPSRSSQYGFREEFGGH